MERRIVVDKWVKVEPKAAAEVVSGKSYYHLPCRKCETWLPILDDNSNGEIETPAEGKGGFAMTCLLCGHSDGYPVDMLRSRKAV